MFRPLQRAVDFDAIRQDLLFKTHCITLLPFNLVSVTISQAQKTSLSPPDSYNQCLSSQLLLYNSFLYD